MKKHNVFKINLLASLFCARYRIHKDEADTLFYLQGTHSLIRVERERERITLLCDTKQLSEAE